MGQENMDVNIFSNAINESKKSILANDLARVNEYIDPTDLTERAVIENANLSNPLAALLSFQNKYDELATELTDKSSYTFTQTADNLFAKNLLVKITKIYDEELNKMIKNLLSETKENSNEVSLKNQLDNLDNKYEKLRRNPLASDFLNDITTEYKKMRIELTGKIREQEYQKSAEEEKKRQEIKIAEEKLRRAAEKPELKAEKIEVMSVDNSPKIKEDKGSSQIFRQVIEDFSQIYDSKNILGTRELAYDAVIQDFFVGQKYLPPAEKLIILEKKYNEIKNKINENISKSNDLNAAGTGKNYRRKK
jgi:hypothetical protein